MKHIKLILDFFHRNKFKSFLVIVILTSAMIIFSTTISQIRYYTVTFSYVDKPEFQNGLLLQASPDFRLTDDDEIALNIQNCQEILDTASSSPYVKGTAGFLYNSVFPKAFYNEISVNFCFTNNFTANEFKPNISEGCWLNECDEDNIPNVVLAGTAFKNIPVGSNIELNGEAFKNPKQKFHVVGKVKYPYYSYSVQGGYSTLANKNDISIYRDVDGIATLEDANLMCYNNIFIIDNDKNCSLFSEDVVIEPNSKLLVFKENTTEEEREALKKQLRNLSYIDSEGFITPAYLELNDIIENTREKISNEINSQVPFNAFVFIIATVSAIIVSFLNVKQKQQNDYAAFLCGCSKKKNLLYTFLSTSILVLIPTILTVLYVALIPILGEVGIIRTGMIYYDFYSYIYIIIYAVFVLLVAFIISSFSIFRKRPIELYRNRLKG